MEDSHDEDMYLFDTGMAQTVNSFPSQTFVDEFLGENTPNATTTRSGQCMNPVELTTHRPKSNSSEALKSLLPYGDQLEPEYHSLKQVSDLEEVSHLPSASRQAHTSNISALTMAPANDWQSNMEQLTIPTDDELYAPRDVKNPQEFEASNQRMATDFDFDKAAGASSDLVDTSLPSSRHTSSASFRTSASFNSLTHLKNRPSHNSAATGHYSLGASRETSPLNALLRATSQSQWANTSSSSGLEETFNSISMNGDSPAHLKLSPSFQLTSKIPSAEPMESSNTPSTMTHNISSSPSTVTSADTPSPILSVYPTSLKSRVETQIPIRMTLAPLPKGVTRLRLPTYTVSKPKFLARPPPPPSADILELSTSLVCTSAMQNQPRRDRAFTRARGESPKRTFKSSPDSSPQSQYTKNEDEKPLRGGEVKICPGCIQRERKRASRKKQKKPDEEELFQKDEERRVIVFNTNEVKDWTEPAKDVPSGISNGTSNSPIQQFPDGAMQVELPMRIACYCRHQQEKMGFQVIFTIKDYTGKLVAQAMTNSIMITDDHKTHTMPTMPVSPSTPDHRDISHSSRSGISSLAGMDTVSGSPMGSKSFKQSLSTTDLQGLQHNFNPKFPMTSTPNTLTFPATTSSATSATMTPRNLSRPASPTGVKGPAKRRKQSGSGKIPSGLTMTKLETSGSVNGSSTMPNTATSTFAPNFLIMAKDRFPGPSRRSAAYTTSPPTPNSSDQSLITAVNRSFSMENLTQQAQISASTSRHPSRPGSASSKRDSFGVDPSASRGIPNQMFMGASHRPPPLIHKLVPAEGSITGGTEVTLLGNGFYQGLEVMFGDVEATTTTFWGEKCLNCIAPPAIRAGTVAVMFKHDYAMNNSMQPPSPFRPILFTYSDDREVEMYRLALKTVGKQMQQPTEDPYAAARQLLGAPAPASWPAVTGPYSGP